MNRQTDKPTGRYTKRYRQTEKPTDTQTTQKQADKPTDRYIKGNADRQTNRKQTPKTKQTDKQNEDRQTNTQTDRPTDRGTWPRARAAEQVVCIHMIPGGVSHRRRDRLIGGCRGNVGSSSTFKTG